MAAAASAPAEAVARGRPRGAVASPAAAVAAVPPVAVAAVPAAPPGAAAPARTAHWPGRWRHVPVAVPCHAAGAPRLLLIHWLRCALPCRAVLCCAGRGGARPGKGGGGWSGCGGWTLALPRPEGLRGSCGLFINGAEVLGEVVPAKGACVSSRCVAEGFPLLLRSTRLPKQRSQPLTTPLWHIEKALKVFILSPGLCVWLCPGCCAFERTLKSNLKTLAKKKKKKKKIFVLGPFLFL